MVVEHSMLFACKFVHIGYKFYWLYSHHLPYMKEERVRKI